MRHLRNLNELLFAVLTISSIYFLPAVSQVQISSFTPGQGSLGGGVIVTILGVGFSTDTYLGGNVVLIGPYQCNVINHLTSDTVITCETVAGSAGAYSLTVLVDGTFSDNQCCFSYSDSLTPTLKAVQPAAGPPGSNVQIYGADVWQVDYDCSQWSYITTDPCVGEITFGDYLCGINSENIALVYDAVGYSGFFQDSVYSLNCTLPDALVTPAPGLGVGASLNATVHFGANMNGGSALVERGAYIADSTGDRPYLFQLYPVVNSVSPSQGSLAGGTLLQISGSGFPDTSLPLLNNSINITVGGATCTVISSNYSQVLCLTPSSGSTTSTTSSLTLPNGTSVYPGMRGISFEVYNFSYTSFSDLNNLGSGAITVQSTNGSSSVLQGLWETPFSLYNVPYYCDRSKAIFTPTSTGNYTFWLAADDVAQLKATWMQANGTQATGVVIATVTSFTGNPGYWKSSSASSPLSLTSGQPVLLDLSHCNGPQVGFAQVAVTVPSSTPKFFSIPETQQITISTAYTPVVQTVSLLTGSSSVSGVNIMVAANSAANAALLSNPQVGIQVTASWMLSNMMYNTNITFPVTATESSAWSAAYQAVGYVASKNGVVSVSKSIATGGTSVTFQVGVNSTLLPSFTLSNAIFILLPSNYPTQLSACASVTTSSSPAPNNSSGSILTQLSYIQSTLSLSLPSTTQLPSASNPASGIITLSVQGGFSSTTFPVNANSSVVSQAVQSLTGVTPQSVTILSGQYGAYLGQRWVITFPFWMGNNVPPLTASASGVTPSSWTAGVTLTALSSSNMTGTFKLAYGNTSCSTVTIDVNVDTSYSISAKIASLASMANITAVPLSVVYNGSTSTGLQITVTFDPQTSPGFLQPLRIADATNLQGTQLSFSVNKLLNGSTNLFYMIPTEITQVPVMTPGTLGVKVNGVPSACAANSSTSCTFSSSSSLTPTITSVSPSSVISFNGSTAVPMTITGTFLSATINTTVVTVGTTACNVTAVSSTQITCSLGNHVMSGVQTVNVNINPYGYASGAVNRTVQVLRITSVTPSTLSSVGWTLVNISSAGIVTTSCSSHSVIIGNQSCYVSACGDGFVSVFYPGNSTSGASASTAAVSLSVLDPATSTVVDTNIWSMNVTIALPSSAPSITSLNSTPTNGAGGLVVAQLGLATLSAAVTAMLLVPTSGISVNGGANYSSLYKAFSGGYTCVNATAVTNTSISCNSGPLPNGAYYLVVQYAYTSNSTTVPYTLMYVSQTISTVLTITSVSPSVGSIGGGTNLTITGSGFSTTLSQNVVLIQVPVSSTFLNGLVLCDVKSATNTSVTCVTRPCLAADATSADPNALLVQPTASAPAPVQLVICNPGLNDVNKLVCWSQARTPAATCTANSTTGCFFSYAVASTPTIQSVNPTAEQGGLPITIVGVYFTGVSQVSFLQGSKIVSNASVTFVNDTVVTAVVPALPAGAYSITLYRSNGEASVIDPQGNGSSFLSQPFLTGLVNNIGSMVGGNVLTLLSNASANGDTTGFNVGIPSANVVSLGGLPCSVVSSSVTSTSLQCIPSAAEGKVLAEYWNFPVNVYSAPELSYLNQQTPTLTRYESSASLIWQLVGPGAPVSPTFFVGRFTFYLSVPQQGNYTFFMSADDSASLYVNELLVVGSQGSYTTTLPAGPSQFIIIYQQFGGWAQISFQWNAGVAGSQAQALPWGQVTPFLPGTPLPVTVTVNGVPSVPACATQLLDASSGGGLGLPLNSEPASATLPNGYCGYLYSSYRTPTLSASASSAVVYSPSSLTVMGSFLAGVSTRSYTAQVGGFTATVMSIATSNSSTVPQLQNLTLGLPLLPAGTWPVQVVASGFGAVRGPLGLSTPLISINYGLSINTGLSFIPNSGKASFWGGVTLTITGSGFVPSNASLNNGMAMNVSYMSGGPGQNYLATVLSSTTSVLSLYISPWYNASLTPTSGNVYFRINVWNQATPSTAAATTTFQFPIDPSYTPTVLSVSPSSIPPTTTGASITLQWQIKSSPLPSAASSGSSSVVTVTFLGGSGSTYACTSPTVTASVVGSSSTIGYNETLTCTLPTYLPAASYTVVVTHPSYGVGYLPAALTVALSVTSISPSQGSLGGGLAIVLSGTGFSILNGTTSNTVMFGGVVCDIISVNVSQLTCITRAYPNASTIAQPVASTLSASALPGVLPTSFSAVTFTYSPSLTDNITAINTTRGSTAGGTPLLITGTFQGNQSNYQVLLGGPNSGASCNITSFNTTSITCITSAPPTANPASPFLICVLNPATGCAYSATSLSYQYVNLWSRRSTWGGGTPPSDGDTVFIPSGTTVVLDISPPRLYLLVIQGNLMFDPQANTSIWLQCNYILVMGGNFSAGTPSTPYAGPNAKITLWGPPGATELPIYGSKVVGVRQGWFILHGQHKTPVWTQLNATANTKDTSITVNGIVNWVPGDRIAISSSSVYATDVDEANIVSVTTNTVTNTSTLVLDMPLNFTHLGVVMTNFPNDSRNHVLDMRAEVAVLTRNVQLEGDITSSQYQFGATVLINTPASLPRAGILFEQAEFSRMGQAFLLGRYAIHWHLQGVLSYNQYIRGCAIHNSYQRAVTVHGTFQAVLENNVAYDVMAHTFFLEDGIESGNIFDGNLGFVTRASQALLNTDTSPATFWITHPNNTYRNNVGAGSTMGYGFWYSLASFPTGPSATTTVCPKFTPLGEFSNNRAHSNMFYGLRIHPEYYPSANPCSVVDPTVLSNPFAQVPAVFNGFVSYKNGMKGAIATQVGLVQFVNMTLADNGGGPLSHIVNGKDNGAGFEMTWIVDDRSRINTSLTSMAGLQNTIIISRTLQGQVGTAGQWPSGRRITGVINQSPPEGSDRHTALSSMINITFVNYTGGQYIALEACGKCKTYQGGATTHTAGITFSNPTGVPVVLSGWSWGHQGIYNDTDGTLLNSNSLTSGLMPSTFSLGPGASWHSAVNNDLFDPSECVYVQNKPTANNGAFCSPSVIFRRVMLNRHQPPALEYRNIWLTNITNNRSSYVFFQHYNEDGYQFTVPTLRQTWIHWDMDFRLDPSQWVYHKMDPLNSSAGYVYLTEQFVQRDYDFLVSGVSTAVTNLTQLPAPSSVNTSHAGVALYNKTFTPDTWSYGNNTYNSTQLTVLVQGNLSCGTEIPVVEDNCPPQGCNNNPTLQVDIRNGTLYWSQNSTWVNRPGGAPVTGDNVTIPYGWNLVIDVDTPSLSAFVIQGNVTVSQSTNVTITATYMIVYTTGYFWIGQRNAPHPPNVIASIVLNGTRQNPDWAVNNNLDLGSKVLAAYNGGKIDLYGAQTGRRWTRLVATASANTSQLVVDGVQLGWSVGQKVLVTSSAWNLWQAEFRTIMSVAEYPSNSNMTNPPAFNATTLTLDSPLTYSHWAKVKAYPGASSAVDMRVEVALVSSNIHITAADGPVTYIRGTGELFGARIIVAGNSSARISNIAMSYGGQAGLQRPAIQFQNLTKVDPTAQPMDALPNGGGAALTNVTGATSNTANMLGTDTLISNPSFVADSSFIYNMDSGAGVTGVSATSSVTLTGNVFYESYDVHTVDIETDGNIITNNLALGTIKEMANVSAQNLQVPATFNIASSNNVVSGNTAAGSERVGFILAGPPCGAPPSFFNNTAHSSIVGFWLKSSSASQAAGCTVLYNCTAFMSWDFGVITTQGIVTSVQLTNVNVLDSKHAGMLILKVGQMHDPAQVNITGGIFAGATGPEVCGLCNNRVTGLEMVSPGGGLSGVSTNVVYVGDAGCAEKLTPNSYNLVSPFTPAVGLLSSTFALEFTPGPDRYPWDGLKGYPTILGISRQYNLTFADYQGPNCSAGTYALGNHVNATDAFHPHQFWGTNMVNVAQNGMVLFNGPDPTWRDEAHCGLATFTQPDGSLLNLNCGGPKHAIFRDMDGSMLSSTPGQASALAGQFGAMRTYPFDQGTPLPDGPCVYNSMISGYNCWSNMSTFTTPPMVLTLKPNPIPKAGIFGDPQLFVLESMDSDTETRNFGPVRFNVSGAVDLVITPFDHGWCFAYSCQMRISNFWTYIPTGQLTNITFTGSPPKTTQLWMPYADPGAEAIFVISYLGMPNRKFIWTETNGRYPGPSSAPPKIGDGSGHGAFYWDQSNTILWVKMVGGYQSLQVRTDNAVMVSNTLAMDINTFYSNQATFISGLAFLLGIDTSRIFIANIVPGSVVVNYSLSDSNTTGTDVINAIVPDLSQNVDGATKTILALMTPAERAALQASYFADNAAQAASQSSSTISSPPPPPSPPASTTSLLSLLTALMAAVLDGSLAKAIGAQVLGFSVDVSGASGLNAADLAAITQLASSINSNATFNPPLNGSSNSGGSGSGAGSTGVGLTPPPSSGTGGTGLNVPLVVGLVVGLVGFAVLAVALSAFIYIRHRANSSDNLAGGIGKAGKSATAVAPSISSRAIPFDASAYEDDGSGSLAGSGSGSGSAKRTSGKVVSLSSPTFSEVVPSSTAAAAAAAGGAAALSLLSSSPSGSNLSKSGGNNPSGSYPSPPRTPAGISLHEDAVANAAAPTPFIFSPPAGQQKRLSSPSGLPRSAAGNPPRSSAPPHSDYSDRSLAEAGQVMYSGAGGEKGMATFYLPGGAASTRVPVDASPSPLSTSPRASSRRNSHGSAGMTLLEPERNGHLIVSTTLNTSAPIDLVEASELESPMATAASSRARALAQLHSDSMAEREQKEGDGSTAAAAAGSPLRPAVTVRQLPPLDPGTRMTSVKLPPLTFRNKDN